MERDSPSLPTSSKIADVSEHEKKTADELNQPPSPNALKVAATECLNSWIYYLQMLNSLCSAGLKLSHCLGNLAQTQNAHLANQCTLSWDELTKATLIASHTVKTHIAAAMQDMMIGETFTDADAQRQQDHNQTIITENILTFVNLQYQFSIAGCECLGSMAMCPQCQTAPGASHDPDCSMAVLQQCFTRLHHHVQEPHSRASPAFGPLDKAQQQSDGSPKHEVPSSSSSSKPCECARHQQLQHSPSLCIVEGVARGAETRRASSPFHESVPGGRGPSPVHASYPEAGSLVRGPFPMPGQLHTMKSPFPGRGSRSPLHFPLFPPLSAQRRWSEAAAGDVTGEGSGDGSAMRRWSMPWDCGRGDCSSSTTATTTSSGTWHGRYHMPSKLNIPQSASGMPPERSRSATPEAAPQPGTITSGEGLAEAIQLLSCRPARCAIPHDPMPRHSLQGPPFPGAPWGETHEERMHRRMYPSQRGNWQSIDVPQSSGMVVTEHFDIFPTGLPLTSRKSSSSTDSSSCLSIHSRSTTSSSDKGSDSYTGGGDAIRLHTNLYSMWSGNEHLPFIRLPESQEPQDDSDTENTPTDQTEKGIFPKPT